MSIKNKLREIQRTVNQLQDAADMNVGYVGPTIIRRLEDGSIEIVKQGRTAPGYEDRQQTFLPERIGTLSSEV